MNECGMLPNSLLWLSCLCQNRVGRSGRKAAHSLVLLRSDFPAALSSVLSSICRCLDVKFAVLSAHSTP